MNKLFNASTISVLYFVVFLNAIDDFAMILSNVESRRPRGEMSFPRFEVVLNFSNANFTFMLSIMKANELLLPHTQVHA